MNRIIYATAGSHRWGMGHLKRSLEIIELLKQEGREIYSLAYVPDDHDGLKTVLDVYDQTIHVWDEWKNLNAQGCVVDLPLDVQEPFLSYAKKNFKAPVFAIEWYPSTDGVVVDSVNLREGKEGLQFAIIRRDILKAAKAQNTKRYDCMIMLGGKDQQGYLPKILNLLIQDSRLNQLKVAVILGPMDGASMKLDQEVPGIEIFKDPSDLAQLMASSRIALSNAGSSLMEFCALGIPTIICPQTELEEEFAQVFISAGCSVKANFEDNVLIKQIYELHQDNSRWAECSARAKTLIDGQGAQRIVNRIIKVFNH